MIVNILIYVNLVFNILFSIFVGYLLYSVSKGNNPQVKKSDKNIDKKSIQAKQDYRRK